jgi:hypothetical protein
MKEFRDFEEAREFTRALNLKCYKEWQVYCVSGNKPNDIPSTPRGTYKNNGWSGFGDWLGTGTVAVRNRVFRSFKEAREFARSLNLKNQREWFDYCKSGNKPDDIPANPTRSYKKDFKGYGDWLGTGTVANYKIDFRLFTEAREFARALHLKGQKEWQAYCTSGNKPDDIPRNPQRDYKKDFKGYGDWLGTGTVRTKQFRPFKEAREFAISLNLKTQKEWAEYCASGNKPDDIPADPTRSYKKDFKGYGDWLGTGTVANQDKQYRPFTEAREFVRSLGLKGQREWKTYCTSGNKPDDIPSTPWNVYKEWKKK